MNIEKWAFGLWRFVDEHLVVGRPFFLCVDGTELQRIARQSQVDFESPSAAEADFLQNCLTRVHVSSGRAQLDRSVFEPLENGRSLAICFAVQQILAAERMTGNDEASSDAYYARYRQVLGLDPSGIGSPLPYRQFQEVWNTLRREMLSLPGAGLSSITFHNGRGKNKYRALPMSQALLDQEALRVIHDRVSDIQNRLDDDLLHRIRRVSGNLSKRSREKVYVDAIRASLLSQVRSFVPEEFARPARGTSRDESSGVEPGAYFVYIEDDGWDDVYRLGIRAIKDPLDQATDLSVALRSYFQQHTVLAFVEGSVSDFEGISVGDGVLADAELIVVPDPISKVQAVELTQYFKEPKASAVPDGYRMLLRDHSVSSTADVPSVPFVEEGVRLSLVGGIMVDRLRRTYLAGFTPTAVKLGEEQVASSETITVNGESTTVGEFLQLLCQPVDARDFHVVIDGHAAYLGIASARDTSGEEFGYPIHGGFCNATAEKAGKDAAQYLQVSDEVVFTAALARRMRKGELLKHLSLPSDSWLPAGAQPIDVIIRLLRRELVGSRRHCEYLVSEISRLQELPVTLVKVLSEVRHEVAQSLTETVLPRA